MTLFPAPQSDYHPDWPYWLRLIGWNLRNFGGGLSAMLRTDSMPGVSDWNPKGGFVFLVHKSGLPFLSYRAPNRDKFPWIEGYIGWRPNGAPGIAFRRADARGY